MTNPVRYLAAEEREVAEIRRHPIVLVRPVLETLGAIVGTSLLGLLLSPGSGDDLIDRILAGVVVVFVLRLLWRVANWWEARIVLTSRRLLEVSGLLTRRVASMALDKVTDTTYRRSVLGRILGYGDLCVESPGQEQGLYTIDHLPRPDEFYRTVMTVLIAESPPAKADEPPEHAPVRPPDEEDTGPLPTVIV